jgi:hypothetical protein
LARTSVLAKACIGTRTIIRARITYSTRKSSLSKAKYGAGESCRRGKERIAVLEEVYGAVNTCKGALAVVLAAQGADCADTVGEDGLNDDRSVIPVEGREATSLMSS